MLRIIHYIIQYLKDYIADMLPYMLYAIPAILLIRIIAVKINQKRHIRTTIWHEIGFWMFAVFLVGLASQTIMPLVNDTGDYGEIVLQPGKIFRDSFNDNGNLAYDYFVLNFLGNIGIFIPVGFFVPLLWRRSGFLKSTLIGFGISLTIELFQLTLPRVTDIDDLWMNTLGTIIGFLIYVLLDKFLHPFFEKWKVLKKGEGN